MQKIKSSGPFVIQIRLTITFLGLCCSIEPALSRKRQFCLLTCINGLLFTGFLSPKLIIIFMITMNCQVLAIFSLLFIITLNQIVPNPPFPTMIKTACLAFQGGICITCPYNYHIQDNECYRNINGCLNYTKDMSGMTNCQRCDQTISIADNKGGCSLTVSQEEYSNTRYYFGLVSQYGDLRFQSISVNQALSDNYFSIANNFMLYGQYRSYITRGTQPVRAVSSFRANGQAQFRVLYNGSGGGLMLCIITVKTANNAIILHSFVLIALTNIIEYCDQYSLNIECLQCSSGYHLQNSICYPNIENCISYHQNICLQCSGYSYLIENRCITTCSEMADSSMLSYFNQFRFRAPSVVLLSLRSYLLF